MKKILVAIVSLMLAIGGSAAPSFAYANTANWAGNGSNIDNNGNFSISEQCNNGEASGIYLLWVLTAKNASNASIDFDGAGGTAPAAMTKMGGGSFHYVQTFPNGFVQPMVGLVSATYDGPYKKATLTLSHGCLPHGDMSVVKSVTSTGPYNVGSSITYSIVVTNTGSMPLTNVVVTDPNATVNNCTPTTPVATLAIGSTITCTATHVVTLSDKTRGSVCNTATASSDEVTKDSNTTNTPIFVPSPSLTISKTFTGAAVVKVGDVAHYTLTITNNGNVPLHNVGVTDAAAVLGLCSVTVPVATFAVGASFTCDATHIITDADFTAGKFDNTATANSNETGPTDSNLVDIPLTPAPVISIHKIANNGASAIGQVLNYTIVVQNTGNVTATGVTVTDANATLGVCKIDGTGSAVTMPVNIPVGSELDCDANHTVTDADMLAGVVTNTASATSTNADPKTSNEVTNPLTAVPSLNVVKSIVSSLATKVGDVITYHVQVTNNGNIPLHNVTLTDGNATIDFASCTKTLPTDLDLGDSFTCTASHTVTDADMNAGNVANIASATSTEKNQDSNEVDNPLTAAPSMQVVKTITNGAPSVVGDVIQYSVVVTNNGNETLNNVAITDNYADLVACDKAAPVTLGLGEALTCTYQHVTTDADFTAGHYANVAAASSDQKSQNSNQVDTPLVANPAVSIVKTNTTVVAPVKPGDTITYGFIVTNTGNVTLHNVTVVDAKAIVDGYYFVAGTPLTGAITLAPGETVYAYGHHVTTNDDFVAGHYVNVATAHTDEKDSLSNPVNVPLNANPLLELSKSQTSTDPVHVGDVITYRISIHNAGNIILHNVTITDPNDPTFSCAPIATFEIGAYADCTAQHVSTAADFDNRSYTNVAFAKSDETTAPPSTVVTDLLPTPALTVSKALDGPIPTKIGDVIHYIINVENTGNVDLTGVKVTDNNAVLSDCLSAFDLAYATEVTCHASHVVTAADMAAGYYDNIASAKTGDTKADSNLVHVPVTSGAGISVTKHLDGTAPTKVGEVAHYTIVIQNTGNIGLTNVNLTDPVAQITSCTPALPAALAVGASITCTATHVATDADFAAGKIDNIAHATSTEASANSNLVHLPLTRAANMSILKRIYGAAPAKIGDVINYHVTYTNIGNVDLNNVFVTDENGSFVNCDDSSSTVTKHKVTTPYMALGATITCRVTHVVTRKDAVAGKVVNVAIATSDEITVSSSTGTGGLDSNQVVVNLRYNGGTALSVINAKGFTGGSLAFTGGEENLANDGTTFFGLLILGALGFIVRRRLVRVTK